MKAVILKHILMKWVSKIFGTSQKLFRQKSSRFAKNVYVCVEAYPLTPKEVSQNPKYFGIVVDYKFHYGKWWDLK